MIKIGLKYVVSTFAPIMLGDNWKKYNGLNEKRKAAYFKFNCDFSYYDENTEFLQKNCVVHVIVTQNHEVFYAVNNAFTANVSEFIFECAHDSCWRSMDFMSDIYFKYCKKVHPDVAPVNIHQQSFIMSQPIIIDVLTKKDPNCSIGYKRVLVSIG